MSEEIKKTDEEIDNEAAGVKSPAKPKKSKAKKTKGDKTPEVKKEVVKKEVVRPKECGPCKITFKSNRCAGCIILKNNRA